MLRRAVLRASYSVLIAAGALASPSNAQLTERFTRCLPYPTYSQEVRAMHAELDAKMASAYPGHGFNEDFPPLVFDAITIDPSSSLSASDRTALIGTIRSSSETAGPGWLDQVQGMYVAGYFKDRGYFLADASVTSQTLKTDPGGVHVAVTVVTNEGAQYRMGKVSFRPADPDQPLFFSQTQLEHHVYLKDGDIFAASSIRRTLDELKTLYVAHGFIDFVGTPITDIHENTRKIDLTFELDEQKQFRTGNVTIDTSSDEVRASIRTAFAPGAIFNAELISKVLKDNAALLPSDVSLDDVEWHRHVKQGTVDITFHLNPCPIQQN
jgi:Surface antigen variable number repeat